MTPQPGVSHSRKPHEHPMHLSTCLYRDHHHRHTTHKRVQAPTTRQAPPSATARHPKSANQQDARLIAHSSAAYNTQAPRTRKSTRTAPTTAHCANTTARTPQAHSSAHPTHRPQKIRPSHTRGLRTTLTIVESGFPASTGCCRRVGCCASPSSCRPHTAHRKSHPVTHAASAPHSHKSCQAAQRRWDATGELVVVQPQLPAGHRDTATIVQVTARPQRCHARANKRSAHKNNDTATANSERMPQGTHMQNRRH
jgi:hypothetical protein